MNIDTVILYHLTSEDRIHYVLANLLCQRRVIFVIVSGLIRHPVLATPQIFIQLCFYHFTSENIRHHVLSYLPF